MMSLGNRIFIGFLMFASAMLIGFGTALAFLGGSFYYLAAGLAVGLVAYLSFVHSKRALPVFAVFYIATAVWAFWESGADGWALAPRLGLFTVLGLWMLSPSYRRSVGLPATFKGSHCFWGGLTVLIVASLAVTFHADRISGHKDGDIVYAGPADPAHGEWQHYGNSAGGTRYSPLTQITPDNVGLLEPVWTYHAGTSGYEPASLFEGMLTIEATPLKIGERLYFCTGYNDVIALEAETGKEAWRHRTRLDAGGVFTRTCRGVAYYRVPNASGICSQRIYTATLDARLIALDADTGKQCADFGVAGEVDLRQGMGIVDKGYYYVTSPPTVIKGRLVLGGWVMDGQRTDEPPGVIRAFDAVTGKFSWAFDIGRPDEHGLPPDGKTFTRGTPTGTTFRSHQRSRSENAYAFVAEAIWNGAR